MFLQHAQNLGLRVGAHVGDFIEEEAAPVRLFEAANPLPVGSGEGSLLMAEQLRFQQVLLKGRAVDPHEVARRAVRVVMNGARDELFAGAGLAADQHGRVALRDLAHDVEHSL